MKRAERKVMMMMAMILCAMGSFAQTKLDEERMQRDLEVAENILSTMLKQQFEKRSFFPMDVKSTYRSGYGVTFTLPAMQSGFIFGNFDMPTMVWTDGQGGSGSYSSSWSSGDSEDMTIERDQEESRARMMRDQQNQAVIVGTAPRAPRAVEPPRAAKTPRAKKEKTKAANDSLREETTEKTIKVIQEFMADYGDLIGQLTPTERIIVTNRGEGDHVWFGAFNKQSQPTYLSIEATKGDLTQYKQGKITREQLYAKIKVINTKTENELQPDLELLASIFNRLYRSDLSKTFFTQENTYYERLKDFGVIYYMQVYSSNQQGEDFWSMPTLSLNEVDQATRDKKVKELYPLFVTSIKEDMLEYGRTLKSLKGEEDLILNIVLTRCRGCQIPSTLELSVKNSVLKDFSSGKLSKEAALAKIQEKKGADQ